MSSKPKGGGSSRRPSEHLEYHKDGSLWARGPMEDGVPTGYWEWFRKDGTKLRSGHFDCGRQVGAWTTYDQRGEVYKVTVKGGLPTAGSGR